VRLQFEDEIATHSFHEIHDGAIINIIAA
jgi:hypothetical protein